MKQADSRLIKTFLFNVKEGNIISKTKNEEGLCVESGGQVYLDKLTEALQAILDGEEPDTALKIERSAGQPSDPRNLTLALIMRSHVKNGRKNIDAAELDAKNWLESMGHKKLSSRRLRVIREQHKSTIEQMESYTEIKKMLEKRFPKTE